MRRTTGPERCAVRVTPSSVTARALSGGVAAAPNRWTSPAAATPCGATGLTRRFKLKVPKLQLSSGSPPKAPRRAGAAQPRRRGRTQQAARGSADRPEAGSGAQQSSSRGARGAAEDGLSALSPAQQQKLESLVDPVHLQASCVQKTEVRCAGGTEALDTYMRLPVEAYTTDVLAGGQISRIEGNLFCLEIPPIGFFSVKVQPRMDVVVQLPDAHRARVALVALRCQIAGSPLIERMALNDRFALHMETEVTWSQVERAGSEDGGEGEEGPRGGPAGGRAERSLEDSPEDGLLMELAVSSELHVWSETIAPFNRLPADLVARTCSSILKTVSGSLIAIFLSRLSADYLRWSQDSSYREERCRQVAELATSGNGEGDWVAVGE